MTDNPAKTPEPDGSTAHPYIATAVPAQVAPREPLWLIEASEGSPFTTVEHDVPAAIHSLLCDCNKPLSCALRPVVSADSWSEDYEDGWIKARRLPPAEPQAGAQLAAQPVSAPSPQAITKTQAEVIEEMVPQWGQACDEVVHAMTRCAADFCKHERREHKDSCGCLHPGCECDTFIVSAPSPERNYAGAAYNAMMEAETKESLIKMVLDGFDALRVAREERDRAKFQCTWLHGDNEGQIAHYRDQLIAEREARKQEADALQRLLKAHQCDRRYIRGWLSDDNTPWCDECKPARDALSKPVSGSPERLEGKP